MTATRVADPASLLEGGTPNGDMDHTSRALEVIRWLRLQDEEERAAGDPAGPERGGYLELVDLVPWSYVETDLDGVIMQASLATGTMLRVSRNGLVGTALVELVAAESIEHFKVAFGRVQRDDDATGWEMRVQPSTGPPLKVFVAVTGGWDEGGNRVLRWLLHDIPGDRGRKHRRTRRRPSSMVKRRRRSKISS
jgi:hypothetical protein